MAYNFIDPKLLTHPKFAPYLHDMENIGKECPGPKASLQNGSSHSNGFHKQNGTNCESHANGSEANQETAETAEITIPVPWGHISAKAHGSPSGTPILAVHGWMDNAGTFDRLIPLLSNSFYVVAVDLPGHGLSSHLPLGTPYHFADFIISLRRIVNHLQWTKFSWMGHSMGAGLGVMYASVFPSQVDHLIMIDLTKPITCEVGTDAASKIAMAVDHFLALEEKIQPIPPAHTFQDALSRVMKGTWGNLSEEAARALMIRGARQVGDDQWCFARDLRLRSPSIFRLSEDQCSTILGNLKAATMIIKASDAPWFEPREACENAMNIYRKNCSAFRFVQVDGNHFVHLNEPEQCADHINQFLEACDVN